jgi:hypothetical protein
MSSFSFFQVNVFQVSMAINTVKILSTMGRSMKGIFINEHRDNLYLACNMINPYLNIYLCWVCMTFQAITVFLRKEIF